jgi:hypothetical protein
VKWK